MQAYHGSEQLKSDFMRLLEWHKSQDKIVQGAYWTDEEDHPMSVALNGFRFTSDGRGCAVGCSIESLRIITKRTDLDHQDHAVYEELIGVPKVLARLEDGIFEGLPVDEAREWPIRFADAIRAGADLSLVWSRFAVWLLGDKDDGVIRLAKTDQRRAAIQTVIDLYLRRLEGQEPTREEWQAAAAAAADAYADAYAYAAAYAAYAAYAAAAAAADAYAAAAAYAAYAAYAAAATYTTAKQQARRRQAAKLLELLRAA